MSVSDLWSLVFIMVPFASMLLFRLLDAKKRIARIEHKVNLLLRHSGIDLLEGLPLSDRVKELARDPARKIEAIKVYRQETGAGLAEAKEAVEAYLHSA